MTDITTLSIKELLQDYAASQQDMRLCEQALADGIETYGGNLSVRSRLEAVRGAARAIEHELVRRGLSALDGVRHAPVQ